MYTLILTQHSLVLLSIDLYLTVVFMFSPTNTPAECLCGSGTNARAYTRGREDTGEGRLAPQCSELEEKHLHQDYTHVFFHQRKPKPSKQKATPIPPTTPNTNDSGGAVNVKNDRPPHGRETRCFESAGPACFLELAFVASGLCNTRLK